MSVRLDPTLETRVEQESRRLGVTKSEFVKDALERVLGLKNPADLLSAVRSGKAMGNPQASRNVSARMKAKLRAKLPDCFRTADRAIRGGWPPPCSIRCVGERIVGGWTSTHYDLALYCRGLVSTGNTPAF